MQSGSFFDIADAKVYFSKVYADTTHYNGSPLRDSIKIISSYHLTDCIRTEYIIKEYDNRVYITADIISDVGASRLYFKTLLNRYNGVLPDPAWPGPTIYLSKRADDQS